MSLKPIILLPVSLFFTASALHAEVVLDGTLGTPGALPGPEYQIPAELGQQHDGNLFHSFQQFNLHAEESATFSANSDKCKKLAGTR